MNLPVQISNGIFRRYALAVACIVAPIFFAVVALDLTVTWLVPGNAHNIPLAFEFSADVAGKGSERAPAPAGAQAAAPSLTAQGNAPTQAKTLEKPDPKIDIVAQDLSGRFHYAVATAFLYLASAAALIFAAVIVYTRLRGRVLLTSFVVFCVVAYAIAQHPRSFELIRPLVVDNVLNASDQQPILKDLVFKNLRTGTPYRTGSLVAEIVHFNTFVALLAVGMLLTALYSVSVRRVGHNLTAVDLKTRRFVVRCVLGLGSTILVIAVLASKILVEWPPALLSKSQELALKPIGEASTILLGAMGTIGLIAAVAPAVVAYMLDVRVFLATHHLPAATVERPAQRKADDKHAAEKPKKGPAQEDFGFATLSNIAGVMQMLAPVLISPVIEMVKAFLAIIHSS